MSASLAPVDAARVARLEAELHAPRAASTPPAPAMGPDPSHSRGPIRAAGEIIWQNGAATEEMRARWAAGARAVAHVCPDCTAPLVWDSNFGGALFCAGCTLSTLPLAWRRRVTELWLTGMKATDIAKKLKSTKNAVMGYRTRAMLPGRGSPLRGVPGSPSARRRARAIRNRDQIKLKPPPPVKKAAAAPRVAQAKASPRTGHAAPGGAGVIVAENDPLRPKGLPRHAPRRGFATCQFITGRTFCDDPVAELSPYCQQHTLLCFA